MNVSVWWSLSAGQVVFVQKHWLCQRGNTKLWVFTFSSRRLSRLVHQPALPSLVLLFRITIRWSVLLNQAGPESTSLANPRRHRSTLNSNTPALRTNTLRLSLCLHVLVSLSLIPPWLQYINYLSPNTPLTFHSETWNWILGIKNQSCYHQDGLWNLFLVPISSGS